MRSLCGFPAYFGKTAKLTARAATVSGSNAKLCLHICNANTWELTSIGAVEINAAAQVKPLHGMDLRAASAAACFRKIALVRLGAANLPH